MSDKPFSYTRSLQLRKDLTYAQSDWNLALDQYKNEQYFEALCSTLRYIDIDSSERFVKEAANSVKVSHGSVQMTLSVNNGQFQVLAPFVDIAPAQKLIVLRRICEMNFNVLTLATIECKGDLACFVFTCPLEACEPWKIYDLLKEICWTADKYDDDFVALHGAAWVFEPDVVHFSEERKLQSWQGFKQTLSEANNWIGYWKQQGYYYIVWDIVYVTLMKIDHLCSPQGSMKNFIETNVNRLFEKREITDLANDGIAALSTLDNFPQSAFFSQLYDVSTYIPSKITGSSANIQASLKQSLEDAYNHLIKKEMITAYLCLQKAAYRLLFNYRFNATQWQHLENSLSVNDGATISEVANQLYKSLNDFYTNPLELTTMAAPDKQEEKKSLFANWFN